MVQHLREHAGATARTNVGLHATQVYMQTFFRGNKVHYFEVDPGGRSSLLLSSEANQNSATTYKFINSSQGEAGDAELSTSSPNASISTVEDNSITQHQMEELMYLHHYTTSTSLSMTRGTEPHEFWIHDVPLEASTQPFLMHGILGVAAFHRAWITSDPFERQRHRVAGLRHQSAGLNIFRGIVDRPTQQTSTALAAFARLLGVQWCAEAVLEAQTRASHPGDPTDSRISKILEFMLLLRGGLDLLLNMQSLLPSVSPIIVSAEALQGLGELETRPGVFDGVTPYLVNHVFTRLETIRNESGSPNRNGHCYPTRHLENVRHLVDLCHLASKAESTQKIDATWIRQSMPSTPELEFHELQLLAEALTDSLNSAKAGYSHNCSKGTAPVLLCYPHIPPGIYSHLADIPSRLFDILEDQERRDVEVFNQAMAALVSSFSRFHMAETTWARWNGIESWPRMLPDRFLRMLEEANPLALTLVAYWCMLLSKQEDSYWFLHGQSERMLNIVLAKVKADLQGLVRHSISVPA